MIVIVSFESGMQKGRADLGQGQRGVQTYPSSSLCSS